MGLMTGDVTINPNANCIVMTTEILRSMIYRGSELLREVAWVIFDEIHYMQVGAAWLQLLCGCSCCAAAALVLLDRADRLRVWPYSLALQFWRPSRPLHASLYQGLCRQHGCSSHTSTYVIAVFPACWNRCHVACFQDRERGVVWEETIIFLQHDVKMVGATVCLYSGRQTDNLTAMHDGIATVNVGRRLRFSKQCVWGWPTCTHGIRSLLDSPHDQPEKNS